MSAVRARLSVSELPLEGVHLIEASAGTGKTYTLAALFLRFILERELPIERILAVTFTTAATLELRHRVGERIEQARRYFQRPPDASTPATRDEVLERIASRVPRGRALELLDRALGDLDRAGIHTIHGFAARVLAESTFELGARFDLQVLPSLDEQIYDAIVDFWTARVATLPPDRYLTLGGSLFEDLRKVAKAAVSNREIPVVDLSTEEQLVSDEPALVAELTRHFERARSLFIEQGREALALLVSDAVNRAQMRAPTVRAAYAAYQDYFEKGVPTAAIPEPGHVRWAQSEVNQRLKRGRRLEHPLFVALEDLLRTRAKLSDVGTLRRALLFRDARSAVLARVDEEQRRARAQSFDDLLFALNGALNGNPSSGAQQLLQLLHERYEVALIDEFQDTDATQYAVFRRIFAERGRPALFLIGDPKQSIYSFRGADVFSYLRAQRDASALWTMPESYRACPALVRAQNALFGQAFAPFLLDEIRYEVMRPRPGAVDELLDVARKPCPGLVLRSAASERGVLADAALDVQELLASGTTLRGARLSPRNFAVLCRTNAQAEQAQRELGLLGIPAVMHGDRSVFESPEAQEVLAIQRALIEPGRRSAVRSALVTRPFGLTVVELQQLEADPRELERWDREIRRLGELWRTRGVFAAFESIAVDLGATERLLGHFGGERAVTNLRHLVELLHAEERARHLGPLGLFRFLEAAIADPLGFAYAPDARQIRLESDADAVVLTTIHKSKGLEYDIVVLPTLAQPDFQFPEPAFRFHDSLGIEWLELRSRAYAEESHAAREREQWAESLRLGYVALTRARHQVRLVVGQGKKGFSSFRYWCAGAGAVLGGATDVASSLSSFDEAAHARFVERLVQSSDGSIRLWESTSGAARELNLATGEDQLHFTPLGPETAARLVETRRTGSFSSMARTQRVDVRQLGRDVWDAELIVPALPAPSLGPAQPIEFANVPRGAEAGELLHLVFERISFARGAEAERSRVLKEAFAESRFAASSEELCTRMLEDVLETPLPGGFCLADLAEGQRASEFEFNLRAGRGGEKFDRQRLLAAVASAAGVPTAYKGELERLEFAAWRGFLRGFIDLTVELEGKLFVIDYKSNYLGPEDIDYRAHALESAMAHHHYYLQALLYAAAVHAHGRRRIVDYEFRRHFGGVLYLFLRGMSRTEPGRGVVFLEPGEGTLDEILRALGHELGA